MDFRPKSLTKRLYAIYLGLLPAAATFLILQRYGAAYPLIIFMVGVAVVSVYIYFAVDMLPYPKTGIATAIALADAPLIAFVTQAASRLPDTLVESALIDMAATWLFIIVIADADKKLPALGFVGVFIAALVVFAWPWLLSQSWWVLAAMGFGVLQALFSSVKFSREAGEADNPYQSEAFILLFLFIWIVALFAGVFAGNQVFVGVSS